MGISSALNAGVMGLNVNASKLSTISDNIANSETKGYKRANVEFSSLVLTERATSYDAGGVRATTIREVDNRGALQSTRNTTDLAIGGSGFFPVADALRIDDADRPLKLVTTGSFRPDEDGVLRTATGFVLLGFPANDNGVVIPPNRESVDGLVPVRIENLALAADPTTELSIAANLPQADTLLAAPPPPIELPVQYFNTVGGDATLTLRFTSQAPTANTWSMDIFNESDPLTPIASATLVFSNVAGEGGVLQNVTDAAIAPTPALTYDGATGVVTLALPNAQTIDLTIGALNTRSNLQQLDAGFIPISISKNGSPASTLTGISIDERGFLDAIFDSGFRRTLYQIPVAAVTNPNGLKALDGQAFAVTRDSGPVYFYDAGDGPTGSVVSSALEESSTDIAEELTQLIKTQRAYSSNAKIIQTVDEMLQETTNLKR